MGAKLQGVHTNIRLMILARLASTTKLEGLRPYELAEQIPKRGWSQIASSLSLLKHDGLVVEEDGRFLLALVVAARGQAPIRPASPSKNTHSQAENEPKGTP